MILYYAITVLTLSCPEALGLTSKIHTRLVVFGPGFGWSRRERVKGERWSDTCTVCAVKMLNISQWKHAITHWESANINWEIRLVDQ